MATFQYHALTGAGRLMKGTIEAGSPAEAAETLKQMELNVSMLEKAGPSSRGHRWAATSFCCSTSSWRPSRRRVCRWSGGCASSRADVASHSRCVGSLRCRGRPGGGRVHRGSVRETGEAVPAALRADLEGGGRDGPAQRDAHEPQPPSGAGRAHAPHHLRGDQLSRRDSGSRRDHHHGHFSVRDSPVQARPARDDWRQTQPRHDRRAGDGG